jgi:acetate---CoA ligase (ADP-forming)
MEHAPLTRHVFTPTQDPVDAGRIILRDGSTAVIRPASSADQPTLMDFFVRLCPDARRQRFFSAANPSAQLVASMCDDRKPKEQTTLLVTRQHDGQEHILAAGTFCRCADDAAEVALTVDDAFQGKGLGTSLLERLALLAVRHGYRRFTAVTQSDNLAMQRVFQDSGFVVREKAGDGEVEVDLTMMADANAVDRFNVRDRVATVASLRPFFQPNGVAVVGASRDPESIGQRTLRALIDNGFRGPIYPINPKAPEVAGLNAFPSVKSLPRQVDLAILTVPRDLVLSVVDDCAVNGVRALIVITAGFAEVRGDGVDLQRQLLEKVRGHGMRMIGPNCMGILNADPAVNLNASFAPVFPPSGRVAMSSQSGALGLAVLAAARRLQLGMSTFVSVGNKADVSGNDLLQYWEEDPNTDVVLLYLESFGNPQRFARIAQRVSKRKPIVAIKSGRGSSGARAAGSHTAALAVRDVVVDALFQQTGIMRVDTLEEMFGLAAALAAQPLPRGNRVAIVTNAGGPGILCADACEAGGLSIPVLTPATTSRLAEFLPAAASLGNPVDMVASASADDYRRTIEAVLTSSDVDALIVLYIPVGLGEPKAYSAAIHDGIAAAQAAGVNKPVLGCWMSESQTTPTIAQERGSVPVYGFPEAPAKVLGRMARYANWKQLPPGALPDFADIDVGTARTVCTQAKKQRGPGWLEAEEIGKLLQAMRLPVVQSPLARSGDEAARLAAALRFPVALKLASRTVVHKTDVGGVQLNLKDEQAVCRGFEQIAATMAAHGKLDAMDGVIVQPMIAGVEVMAGVTRDPLFGPLVGFGLGGVLLEAVRDVIFRIAPLSDRDAAEMIDAIRGRRLLDEFRGRAAVDVAAIRDTILRLSRLVEEVPEIREVDLNPIMARASGCVIVDARVYVQ